MRGYSMLIILDELMRKTFIDMEGRTPDRHEVPKPCDHFDMIAGTGTGGLIAIMLGRLKLDVEACKAVYVPMMEKSFHTDRTVTGDPQIGTLFNASKLEEAMKECVKNHTTFEDESDDATANAVPLRPQAAKCSSVSKSLQDVPRNNVTNGSSIGMISPLKSRRRFGNPDTRLFDSQHKRTRTVVTAVYKGTSKHGSSVLLRSYDARKVSETVSNCTIWQAARATLASGLAFESIRIGHSVFIDEGAGKYNPAPQILEEAVRNEWPGRQVGLFVSIGTGRRPAGTYHQQGEWWAGFAGNSTENDGETRKRLIQKIDGCEETHQFMQSQYLARWGVNAMNYFRFDIVVGLHEFGINGKSDRHARFHLLTIRVAEWAQTSQVSKKTRRFLTEPDVQVMTHKVSMKLARAQFAKPRQNMAKKKLSSGSSHQDQKLFNESRFQNTVSRPCQWKATGIPADQRIVASRQADVSTYESRHPYTLSVADMKHTVIPLDEYLQPMDNAGRGNLSNRPRPNNSNSQNDSVHSPSTRHSIYDQYQQSPPHGIAPLLRRRSPPCAVERGTERSRRSTNMTNPSSRSILLYADSDALPPLINFVRKPELIGQ